MRNIAICTQGSIGISVVRKLFELGFRPEQIIIITYNPQSDTNIPLISFLKYFNINWFVVKNDMEKLVKILLEKNIKTLINISYKYIFKNPIFDFKDITLINLHPGILPDYRGLLSIPWSIFNNEKYVGYTYHIIDLKIDTGPIIFSKKFPILKTSNAFDLHFCLMNDAINQLDKIILENWTATPQVKGGHYYKNFLPNNGFIDISWDIDKIDRFIRAMFFPPHKGAVLKTTTDEKEIFSLEQYILELKSINYEYS